MPLLLVVFERVLNAAKELSIALDAIPKDHQGTLSNRMLAKYLQALDALDGVSKASVSAMRWKHNGKLVSSKTPTTFKVARASRRLTAPAAEPTFNKPAEQVLVGANLLRLPSSPHSMPPIKVDEEQMLLDVEASNDPDVPNRYSAQRQPDAPPESGSTEETTETTDAHAAAGTDMHIDTGSMDMETDTVAREYPEQAMDSLAQIQASLGALPCTGKDLYHDLFSPKDANRKDLVAYAMGRALQGYVPDSEFVEMIQASPVAAFKDPTGLEKSPSLSSRAECAVFTYSAINSTPLAPDASVGCLQQLVSVALGFRFALLWRIHGRGSGGRRWQEDIIDKLQEQQQQQLASVSPNRIRYALREEIHKLTTWANRGLTCYRAFGSVVFFHPAFKMSLYKCPRMGPYMLKLLAGLDRVERRRAELEPGHRQLLCQLIAACAPDHKSQLVGLVEDIETLVDEASQKGRWK